MNNKLHTKRFFAMGLTAIGLLLAGGTLSEVSAQSRDPFTKQPVRAVAKKVVAPTTAVTTNPATVVKAVKPVKVAPAMPTAQKAPSIEERIAFFYRLREQAVSNGMPIPKVTGFLTLEELMVSGIFRTPRGVAAVVQAKPIELSFTVYPGEKFFDGQLVAVEENLLVFRQITKMSNGKFISAEIKRPLREYSIKEEVQGTAPVDTSGRKDTPPAQTSTGTTDPAKPTANASMISPLEEMLKQPVVSEPTSREPVRGSKGKRIDAKKEPKKAVKVAKK
jgi:hypothetical protein